MCPLVGSKKSSALICRPSSRVVDPRRIDRTPTFLVKDQQPRARTESPPGAL
jgi:hypothetical protein